MGAVSKLISGNNNSKGKIRRIKCINFMTYEDMTTYPYEKLNLIIGPNGSGKSTIAIAIILGLGGNPKVAARASQLSDYIRTGCDCACIEIELIDVGKCDVITRNIYSNNKSSWLINGKASTLHEVEQKVKYFQIYVDNLCQVLPQEKIASFSKMTDPERLESTLMAVGNGKLYQDYCTLKDSKSTMEMNTRDVCSLKDKLEKEIQLNERLRVDVNNIKEKTVLVDNVKLYLQKMTWETYHRQLYNFTKVKRMKSVLIGKCAEHRERITPYKQKHNQLMKTLIFHKSALEERLAASRNILNNREKVQLYLTKMTQSMSGKNDMVEENRMLLQCAKLQLTMLQNDKKQVQEKYNSLKDLEIELRELAANIDKERERLEEIERKKNSATDRWHEVANALQYTENELARLSDDEHQKEIIRRMNPDIEKVQSWLEKNKDQFEDTVQGPVCCCVKVKEARMAKYVEGVIARKDLLAFICNDSNDAVTLMRKTKEMGWKVNVITRPQESNSKRKPKYKISQISHMGFQRFLIELIEAPKFIMDYFITNYDIGNIPIGNKHTEQLAEKIQYDINIFFSDTTRFSSTKSRHSGGRILRSGGISEAQLLKKSEEAEQKQRTLTLRKQELVATIKEEESKCEKYSELITQQEDKLRDLYKKKVLLESRGNDPHQLERKLQEINADILRQKEIEKKSATEIATIAAESKSLRDKFFLYHGLIIEMTKEIWIQREKAKEALVNVGKFGNMADEVLNQLNEIRKEFEPIIKLLMDVKQHEKYWDRKLVKYKKLALSSTDDVKPTKKSFEKYEQFNKLSNSLPVLRERLAKDKAKIRCLSSAGGGHEEEILREFNERADLIKKYQKAYERLDTNKNSYIDEIRKLNEQWIPNMSELITSINRSFGKFFAEMKCAGEVSLYTGDKEDDYKSYGIRIKVKFRPDQSLSILNSHEQSGGERAVTTAVYLLSLQELTSVPFRCIDEINQGMDEQNERRIFALLAAVVSEPNCPQYFLITPKVLPKLTYTEDMHIMCPYNGSISLSQDEYNQL